MPNDLASFLKPGLSAASGSPGLARRVAAAAVAIGLSLPAGLAMVAAQPAYAAARQSPAVSAPAVPKADPEEKPSIGIRELAEFREGSATYIAAAVRHGLDPETFVVAATMMAGLRQDLSDASPVTLAPGTGRKGERPRILDRSAARWVDLVRSHGREAGAGLAIDTLEAAIKVEDGQRRKPVTEATVRRIVEMREDANLEAEVLAREVLAVRAKLPKDAPEFDAVETFMALSYGLPRLAAFNKAIADEVPRVGKASAARGKEVYAFRILDASTEDNGLFLRDVGNGRVKPLSPLEYLGALSITAEALRENVVKAIQANQASLEDEGPSTPRLG